ncbi:MAG: flagellar hook-length control protein FliK, partial [Alphaproteobacteria bacterium]|nr:flagellar hook-length control protein FliK [Alphaproteobacteria bacterium]
ALPTMVTAAGNDFASLVAQSNFLNGSGSSSPAPSLLAANQGQPSPQGLQPMAEQLARPMFQAAVLGQASLTVQIHPATLGSVRISLTVDEGKRVKVSISVTRPETLNLLQNDTQALHQALRDAGLLTDDQSLHFSLDQSGGQNQPPPSFYSNRSPSQSLTALQELEEPPLEAPRLPSSSLVDIQI